MFSLTVCAIYLYFCISISVYFTFHECFMSRVYRSPFSSCHDFLTLLDLLKHSVACYLFVVYYFYATESMLIKSKIWCIQYALEATFSNIVAFIGKMLFCRQTLLLYCLCSRDGVVCGNSFGLYVCHAAHCESRRELCGIGYLLIYTCRVALLVPSQLSSLWW